jgi:molybdate transport system ATP-binding protein
MLQVNIKKKYKHKSRVVDIQCAATFEQGKTTAIYGRSGVGKTTVLRIIAGLEQADKGWIRFQNRVWFDAESKLNLSIKERRIGFVFQDYNLFPTMSVENNLTYASKNNILSEQTKKLIEIAEISQLLDSYPRQLSRGQIQRVAIIRALCQHPEILLLDEPFSALDDEVILLLIDALKKMQKTVHTSIIVVSHRADIIRRMADKVIVLRENENAVSGLPFEVLPEHLKI